MKGVIFKLFAGASLKLGVAYALKIIISTIGALRGVLNEGSVSDDARNTIIMLISVLSAVRDFLDKVGALVGAPSMPAYASNSSEIEKLVDGLKRITEGL
jgi:hypothetical protein